MSDNVEIVMSAALDAKSIDKIKTDMRRSADQSADVWSETFRKNVKVDPAAKISTKGAREKGAQARREFDQGFDDAAGRTRSPLAGIAADVDRDVQTITRGFGAATDSAATLGETMAGLGKVAGPAGLATAAVALQQLASVAVTASGALGVLPGVVLGVGSAFGTAKLATMGFSDALDSMSDPTKFAEAVGKLAPNAQQAALEIRNLMPALTELKNATQDAFFNNVGPQLDRLAQTLLPEVQKMTTGIADAMNSALAGVFASMNSAAGQAGIASTVTNITQAFSNLAPAARSVTDAIGELVAVGSDFLPQLAQGAADAAREFASFIHEASQSGQLGQWIQDGITVLGEMKDVVVDVSKTFADLTGDGVGAMESIETRVRLVDDVIKMATGDLDGFKNIFPDLGHMALSVFQGIADSINTFLITPLNAVIGLANKIPGISLPNVPQIPTTAGPPPGFGGGGGNFGTPNLSVPGMPANGFAAPGGGLGHGVGQASGPVSGWSGLPLDGLPTTGHAGGSAAHVDLPTVAMPATAPQSLLQGYPATSETLGAANAQLQAQQRVAQAQSDLTALEASNTAKQDEITKKRNDLLTAQREQQEAQLRLQEAEAAAAKKSLTTLQDAHSAFSDIGAGLDKDLGLSKGLPGLADNLTRFIASLATAPLKGLLAPIAAQGDGSYGLFGMAFGGSAKTAQTAYAQGQAITGYRGDAALLANVPAGKYAQTQNADLIKGLGDCSSAVEDLVNLMDGKSTAGREMSTANAAQWLTGRGFQPGMGGPGDFRVGYNSEHMQATLPGGTPFNWGSDAAAANRGIGGTGADDPAFTQHYFRPAGPSWSPTGGVNSPGLASLAPVDLYGAANTDPALSSPLPPPGSFPGGGSMLPGTGMPQGLTPAAPYQAQGLPQAGPSWQPKGGGGLGVGGLAGSAIQAAISAAGTAGAPFGGQAAAAAAQMGMQLLNRTIAFGGQVAGIGAEGLLDTLSPTDPDTGKNPMKDSWLWRAAGALAGAAPAIGSGGAGLLDKHGDQQLTQQNGPQQGNPNQQQNQPPGPQYGVYIENVHQAEGQSAKSLGQDILGIQTNAATMPRP